MASGGSLSISHGGEVIRSARPGDSENRRGGANVPRVSYRFFCIGESPAGDWIAETGRYTATMFPRFASTAKRERLLVMRDGKESGILWFLFGGTAILVQRRASYRLRGAIAATVMGPMGSAGS
jgi:hypothetical protein